MQDELRDIVEEIIMSKLYDEFNEGVVDEHIRTNEAIVSVEIAELIDNLLVAINDRADELIDEINDREVEEEEEE